MTSQKQKHHHNHLPVLLDEVIRLLDPKEGESYLDLTAGYGGHAQEVLSKTKYASGMMLVDRDVNAIDHLGFLAEKGARLVHQDFASATLKFRDSGEKFDMILLDLGVSSPQLDNSARGFSFQSEAKLDMRMDSTQELSAHQVVNNYSQDQLRQIIHDFGQERRASRVARAIVENRPIETTTRLAEVVKKASPSFGKIHPATRTFQAIRIAVNEELSQISNTLPVLPDLLNSRGRLVIISFHSLEDRIVKNFLKEDLESGYEARLENLTKKPISGSLNDVHNPRARSAKLRAVVKK